MDYKNISRFPGLNALRFIAALFVVLHHSEVIKRKNELLSFEWFGLFRNGSNAVTFFFVLSGFLITYLLLKERAKTGSISVRGFYIKRILRIWPLYFLLIFIGVFLLPFIFNILHVNYEMPYTFSQTWYYFILFLPGLVTFNFGHHFLEPLWSIGVEEVFYLLWAPLFKAFKNNPLILLTTVLLVKVLLMILSKFFISNALFGYLVGTHNFEAMAIGGLGAYFLYHSGRPMSEIYIFKRPFQIILFTVLAIFLLFNPNINNHFWIGLFQTPIFSNLLIMLLFLYVIVCVSAVDNSIIKLRGQFFNYLGEISYGIYMYHMLVIFTTIHFLKNQILHMNPVLGFVVYYGVVLVGTITVSAISKKLFEDFFLNMKEKVEAHSRLMTLKWWPLAKLQNVFVVKAKKD